MRSTPVGIFGAMILVAGLTVVSVGAVDRERAPLSRADPENPSVVALGRTLYVEHCASCHGADLQGQPDWQTVGSNGKVLAPPHDETGHTWHHTDDELFRLTKFSVKDIAPEGYVSGMPAFADKLSDDRIWAVLAFIKSRWPRDVRAYQAMITNPTAAQAAAQVGVLGDDWRFPPLCEEPSRDLAAARQKAARPASPDPGH